MAEKTTEEYIREMFDAFRRAKPAPQSEQLPDGTGGILVVTTTLKGTYPVSGAFIEIYTGTGENRVVIESSVTDESGKSDVIKLPTPPKSLSESAGSPQLPYAEYNISVKADGYVDQIMMNVPVFSGTVSVQNVDLVPIASAGGDTSPQITQEKRDYNL